MTFPSIEVTYMAKKICAVEKFSWGMTLLIAALVALLPTVMFWFYGWYFKHTRLPGIKPRPPEMRLVEVRKNENLHKQTYLCDWIRDTEEELELVRYSKNAEGDFRLDARGNKIEIRIANIIKSNMIDLEGDRFITKV